MKDSGLRHKILFLMVSAGLGLLVWSKGALAVERNQPADPYKGIRESTLRYLALGTPDDLLRLRDAFDKTEEEIARLQMEIFTERFDQFSLKEKRLRELKDRLNESEALLRLLESSGKEIADRELDRLTLQARASLRKDLQNRIKESNANIVGLAKAIQFEQTEYRRILMDERKALARLLVVRREQLLGEYAGLRECDGSNRSCLHRRLKTLCRLRPLLLKAEQGPIVQLIQEIDSQLAMSGQSASGPCEYLQYDFGL